MHLKVLGLILPLALAVASCATKQETLPVAGEAPRTSVAQVPPARDAAMEALVAPYKVEVDKLRLPIGSSKVEMRQVRYEEALGSWVSDALRSELSAMTGKPVDVVVLNSGGIRAPMPAGEVSYMTINSILPFDNSVFTIEASGAELLALGEVLAKRRAADLVSGMTLRVSADGALEEMLVAGKAVDPAATYRIGTISFLAEGNGGYGILKSMKATDHDVFLRDAISSHVKKLTAAGAQIEPPTDVWRQLVGGLRAPEVKR
jgi:2',3'-cyclic-nucleotide 2'-phosphodiesterase (5'-nucleotidase family)